MTIEKRATVIEMLEEAPTSTVYQYRHKITGELLYAFFPPNQYDDIYTAPMVTEPVLLVETGIATAAGRQFLYGRETVN